MLDNHDLKNLIKTGKATTRLILALEKQVRSCNPLLADFGSEILKQTVDIEQRLKRIVTSSAKKAD